MYHLRFIPYLVLLILFVGIASPVHAEDVVSQTINLTPGWNIISTPKVLESHVFSIAETSENFDIYILDTSTPTGWLTMADIGQSEFAPLYGYFINNKSGSIQTLTLNYKTAIGPNEKFFERIFDTPGWYSIGIANSGYAISADSLYGDIDNPSEILSSLEGSYNLFVDFTDSLYSSSRESVSVNDPWKVLLPLDINDSNDLRETKGYAVFITDANARYVGVQGSASSTHSTPEETPIELKITGATENNQSRQIKLYETNDSIDESVLHFKVENESDTDIVLESFSIDISSEGADVNEMVKSLKAEGAYQAWLPVASSTATVEVSDGNIYFEDFNLRIDAWEEAMIKVEITPNSFGGNFGSGDSLSILVDPRDIGWSATDEYGNTLDRSYSTGLVNSGPHTFITGSPIVVVMDEFSDDIVEVDGDDNDYGIFEIELEVTAFEQDVFISTNPATSFNFDVEDADGKDISATGTVSAVLNSSADESGNYYEVAEGETETFILTVTYLPGIQVQWARIQLTSIEFAETETVPNQKWDAIPESDYRTNIIAIIN